MWVHENSMRERLPFPNIEILTEKKELTSFRNANQGKNVIHKKRKPER